MCLSDYVARPQHLVTCCSLAHTMRDVCTWRHIIINKGRCDAWAKRDRTPRLELINAKNVFYSVSVAAQNEKRMGGGSAMRVEWGMNLSASDAEI